jgi:lipopolysaccharide transport system permease protein
LSEPSQPERTPEAPAESRAPGVLPTAAAAAVATSPYTVVISPGRGGLAGVLSECWQYRELLYFLAWRDVKVRYKQTVLGAAWAVLQPLVNMLVFTLVFHKLGGIQAPGKVHYAVFAFAGLLPWMLFQSSLVQSSGSIVSSANLLTKVYFPRLLSPLASVVSALLDFAISLVILAVMMIAFRVPVHWGLVCLPVFVFMAVAAALSVGVWLSALNAKYRDVRYVVPFMAQVWMFLTPVAYSAKDLDRLNLPAWLEPAKWLYHLNPMAGVVEGFRWSLLGQTEVALASVTTSAAVTMALLLGGLLYFRGVERTFADVV